MMGWPTRGEVTVAPLEAFSGRRHAELPCEVSTGWMSPHTYIAVGRRGTRNERPGGPGSHRADIWGAALRHTRSIPKGESGRHQKATSYRAGRLGSSG